MRNLLAPRAILFNGPPYSGKDTLTDKIVKSPELAGIQRSKCTFAKPLKEGVHSSFGLDVHYLHYDKVKDAPSEDFLGLTPRQAYINHSEQYMKVLYGRDVWSKLMLNHIKRVQDRQGISKYPSLFVFSDCGFIEEVKSMADFFGKDNLIVIQLHRAGSDYSDDSRGYVFLEGVRTYQLHNNFSIDRAVESVLQLVKSELKL